MNYQLAMWEEALNLSGFTYIVNFKSLAMCQALLLHLHTSIFQICKTYICCRYSLLSECGIWFFRDGTDFCRDETLVFQNPPVIPSQEVFGAPKGLLRRCLGVQTPILTRYLED